MQKHQQRNGYQASAKASSVLPQFDNEIVRIAQEIERYLLSHPYAADSLEGVVKWWIARQCFEESYDHVQQALDFLVVRGRVHKTKNPGGVVVYASPKNVEGMDL